MSDPMVFDCMWEGATRYTLQRIGVPGLHVRPLLQLLRPRRRALLLRMQLLQCHTCLRGVAGDRPGGQSVAAWRAGVGSRMEVEQTGL